MREWRKDMNKLMHKRNYLEALEIQKYIYQITSNEGC